MIKFRGKTNYNRWVEGYYCKVVKKQHRYSVGNDHYIILDDAVLETIESSNNFGIYGFVEVLPDSISQFTGKLDKNGKEIYGSIEIDGKRTKGGDRIEWNNNICKKEYQNSIWDVVWDIKYARFTVDYVGGGKQSDSVFPVFSGTDLEILGSQFDLTQGQPLVKEDNEATL